MKMSAREWPSNAKLAALLENACPTIEGKMWINWMNYNLISTVSH